MPRPRPPPARRAVHRGRQQRRLHRRRDRRSAYGLSDLYAAGDDGQRDDGGAVRARALLRQLTSPAYQSCYGTATPVTNVDGRRRPGHRRGLGRGGARHRGPASGSRPTPSIDVYEGPNTRQRASSTPTGRSSTTTPRKVISTSWGLCEPEEGRRPAAHGEHALRAGRHAGPVRLRRRRRPRRQRTASSGATPTALPSTIPPASPT